MPLKESEVVEAFNVLFIGNHDKEFGIFLQNHFNSKELHSFWSSRFGGYKIGTIGFENTLQEYLLWEFSIAKLKSYVPFKNDKNNDLREQFVRTVLDTEIFVKEKDCTDVLKNDCEDETAYGVDFLIAQFAFAGSRNRRVDRYIPLNDLKKELTECVGTDCDVDRIVTEYLKKYNESGSVSALGEEINSISKIYNEEMSAMHEDNIIALPESLLQFKKGNILHQSLNEALLKSFTFYRSLLEEDSFKKLMAKTPGEAIRFLIRQNNYLMLTEGAWEKIFNEIETDLRFFERYYPMVRVCINTENQKSIVQAIVLNDDLYQYCMANYREYELHSLNP